MTLTKLQGLIAATYTPMHPDGQLNLDQVGPMVEHLINRSIAGLYVCGSTGEGMSMTTKERKQVAAAFIDSVAGQVPVIVQVGHNSVGDACELARHAADAGADIISATCPSYFKATDSETLVECMGQIAAAAESTPFYYYHIPALTASSIDIVQFLELGYQRIPNLVGSKYTDTKLFEFQSCQAIADGQLDIVFGCDEMLLGALASGATAAIGSTYNLIAPVYHRLIDAFEHGDLEAARKEQLRSIAFIRMMYRYPFHSATKRILQMLGVDAGRCRLPIRPLTAAEEESLRHDLASLGFFSDPSWCG